jgi:phosphohistidine swiveling domain-containing protein
MPYLLKGLPVCRGLAHGRVRLVQGWNQNVPMQRGDVLVARFPLQPLAPLLGRAGALVCAYGSRMAALLVIAREYRIPVVTGIGNGLERIAEGDLVWVDGAGGFVSTFSPRGAWQSKDESQVRSAGIP